MLLKLLGIKPYLCPVGFSEVSLPSSDGVFGILYLRGPRFRESTHSC